MLNKQLTSNIVPFGTICNTVGEMITAIIRIVHGFMGLGKHLGQVNKHIVVRGYAWYSAPSVTGFSPANSQFTKLVT